MTDHFTCTSDPWLDAEKKTYGNRERDETKRAAFLAALGDPKAAHLVYIAELSMDARDDYGYGWSPAGERV